MDKAFWKEKADNEIAIGLLLTPFRTEILSRGGGGLPYETDGDARRLA